MYGIDDTPIAYAKSVPLSSFKLLDAGHGILVACGVYLMVYMTIYN